MKVNVIGFEIAEDVSKKTGNAYSIGKLYAALPLAGTGGRKGFVSRGYMGSEYRCEVSILRKIEHLTPPLMCEVEFQDVMRFGERKQEIVAVVPQSLDSPANTVKPSMGAPGTSVATR